jgi:hypothetical protein
VEMGVARFVGRGVQSMHGVGHDENGGSRPGLEGGHGGLVTGDGAVNHGGTVSAGEDHHPPTEGHAWHGAFDLTDPRAERSERPVLENGPMGGSFGHGTEDKGVAARFKDLPAQAPLARAGKSGYHRPSIGGPVTRDGGMAMFEQDKERSAELARRLESLRGHL